MLESPIPHPDLGSSQTWGPLTKGRLGPLETNLLQVSTTDTLLPKELNAGKRGMPTPGRLLDAAFELTLKIGPQNAVRVGHMEAG